MISDALISKDGQFRYTLTRAWGDGPCVCWIMLNPSTADAIKPDPTITKCIGFSRILGYSQMVVVNLFAYRTAKPKVLRQAGWPVGPNNDEHIIKAVCGSALVIAAWGAQARGHSRVGFVHNYLESETTRLCCLKVLPGGVPGHPLMLPYRSPLVFLP